MPFVLAQVGRPGEHGACVLSGTYDGAQVRPRFNGRPIYRDPYAGGRIRWRLYCTTVTVPVGATAEFKGVSDLLIFATEDVDINGRILNVGEHGRDGKDGEARKGGDGGDGGRGAGGRGLAGQGGASAYGCDTNGIRGVPARGTASQGEPYFIDSDGRTIPCLRALGGGAAGGTGGTKGATGDGYWTSAADGQIGKYWAPDPWLPRDEGFSPFYTWDNSAGGGAGAGGGCRAALEAGAGGGGGGGGAGGAILIVSDRNIRLGSSGAIVVKGGDGGNGGRGADGTNPDQAGGSAGGGGGGGAGGFIYLRARTVSVDADSLQAQGGTGGAKGVRGRYCFNPESMRLCDGADGPGGGGGKVTIVATQESGLPSGLTSNPGQDADESRGGQPTIYAVYEHLECRGPSRTCRKTAGPGEDQCALPQEDLDCP